MAEIDLPREKTGRRKTAAPRVDLTPMVDLGFLLITFFMFTATVLQPKAIDINMPYKPAEAQTAFIDTSTITIIPVSGHKFAYYGGILRQEEKLKPVTINELREIIISKQRQSAGLPATFSKEAHKLHVIIKPDSDSKYEDLVSIIDEMLINDVPYYAIIDLSKEERQLIAGR